MKKFVFPLICLCAVFASAPQAARAQDDAQQNANARHRPSPEEVVSRLNQKLTLSDDQKAKITPIIAERQEKMKALAASSGRRRAKAREMRSIISDSDKKIEAVLTDEQKKAYRQMEQQRREQARERREQRRSGASQ
ncbi:MAG TPA: hypothetical protein VF123_02255 [Candidatus Sulfotelmatobacter sp.]